MTLEQVDKLPPAAKGQILAQIYPHGLSYKTNGEAPQNEKTRKWNPWTLEQDKKLAELIATKTPLAGIGKIMGRTAAAVACRANAIKITNGDTAKNLESIQRRGLLVIKNCACCSRPFESLEKHGQIYCSRACSQRSLGVQLGALASSKKQTFPDRKCEMCGKVFTVNAKKRAQRHCGHTCATTNPEVSRRMILTARSNPNANKTSYATSKKGWLEVGGKRLFSRSSWEANYARFLQFQKEHGLILDWDHETDTFWFEGIKRGVRSYLPDFKVTTKTGVEFHEVKGWMDPKSKTKIRRMAKYHSAVKLVVIDSARYHAIAASAKLVVPGWLSLR